VATLKEQDEVAKDAGQILGTVEDSTSGRVVHFLQRAFIAGQIVSRRMAYDHESPVAGDRLPGSTGEFDDKVRDLAMRGGNKTLLNMLRIMNAVNGSRATQFGRQARATFDTMAAPGGLNNRLMIGFHSPNSRLYLEINRELLFGTEKVLTQPRVKMASAATVGRRAIDGITTKYNDGITERGVTVSIGGRESKDLNIKTLQEDATNKLLHQDRRAAASLTRDGDAPLRKSLAEVGAILEEKSQKSAHSSMSILDSLSYERSIANATELAFGDVLIQKHLRPQFREQGLRRAGYIGRTLTAAPEEQVLKAASEHTGIRVGDKTLHYSFEGAHYLMLPSHVDDVYRVVNEEGIMINTFPQRWHPYYALPRHFRMLLGLTGVHAHSSEHMRIRKHLTKFRPVDKSTGAPFRHELTPEQIVNLLQKLKKDNHRQALLRHMGYTPDETAEVLSHLKNVSLYEDLADASDYASVPDVVKSCPGDRMIDIIRIVSPRASNVLSSAMMAGNDLSNIVLTHYIALVTDELNVMCSLYNSTRERQTYIRLPTVSIT
jgi:hypothetical protein